MKLTHLSINKLQITKDIIGREKWEKPEISIKQAKKNKKAESKANKTWWIENKPYLKTCQGFVSKLDISFLPFCKNPLKETDEIILYQKSE